MNCLQFRRELGIDPQSTAADFVRHRTDCARCADAAARAVEFDAALRRSLQVDAPPQLAESVLLAQATEQNRRRGRLRRGGGMLALAAALVLAVGVGMRANAQPLSKQAVEHLQGEAEVLTSTTPVSAEALRAAFAKRGLALASVPDGVTFVGNCPMKGHRTVHMVMPEADGPVTVIYVVDLKVDQREDFQRDGWRGRSVPLGNGTLVLLARGTDHFDDVETAWRGALQG